jgi:hypothetical protein
MGIEMEVGLENAAKAPKVTEELRLEEAPKGLVNPKVQRLPAGAQAQAMIYGTIQRQAVMMAFIDNFKMLGIVFFAVIAILLLMKKPRAQPGGVSVH